MDRNDSKTSATKADHDSLFNETSGSNKAGSDDDPFPVTNQELMFASTFSNSKPAVPCSSSLSTSTMASYMAQRSSLGGSNSVEVPLSLCEQQPNQRSVSRLSSGNPTVPSYSATSTIVDYSEYQAQQQQQTSEAFAVLNSSSTAVNSSRRLEMIGKDFDDKVQMLFTVKESLLKQFDREKELLGENYRKELAGIRAKHHVCENNFK